MNDRRTPNERSIDTRRPYHPRAFLPWLLLERRDLLPQLTKADILVLAQLALNADHDTGRNAFLSQVKCAAATSLDRKTVRRALHRLAGQFGLIEQTGTRQNRGGEFGIYRLLRPGTTLGHDAPGSDPTLGHDAPDPGASCPPTLGHDAPRPEMIGPGSHDRGVPCSKSGSESSLGPDAPGWEADGPQLPAWAAPGGRACRRRRIHEPLPRAPGVGRRRGSGPAGLREGRLLRGHRAAKRSSGLPMPLGARAFLQRGALGGLAFRAAPGRRRSPH